MKNQQGFSVPELLLTLFIGAAFIATAYQLYGLIVRDGAASRQQAMASDLAKQILQKNTNDNNVVLSSCAASSTTPSTTNPGLPTPFSVSVAVTCPYGTSSSISLVTVTVNYAKTGVTHASYASQD